jgi:hypothetical protein
MRNAILAAVVSAGVWSAVAGENPAAAASAFQWCPVGRLGWGEAGTPSCGFSSYDQCVAATGGVCTQNPFYTGPASAEPRDKRLRRR